MSALVGGARLIAQNRLADTLPQRWRHTVAVAERAQWLAARLLGPDRAQIVVAAAWLHDIGYAPDLAKVGFHPVDGARRIAVEVSLAAGGRALTGLVAHHTGAVFEARERGIDALLREFVRPDAVELAILSSADLCCGPDGTAVDPVDRVDEVLTRYPSDHPVHRAITTSGPMLVAQARLVLAAAQAATSEPWVLPLPHWAQCDPPHGEAIWYRDSHRVAARSGRGVGAKRVELSLTDFLGSLSPDAAVSLADDVRAAAAAAAGDLLCWAQYRAFAADVGVPVADRFGGVAVDEDGVGATFQLGEIVEFQWAMAAEGRRVVVQRRLFGTLGDVSEWVELIGGSATCVKVSSPNRNVPQTNGTF